MHDVIVLYNHPDDQAAFDEHYIRRHVPLVQKLPGLVDFTWGTTDTSGAPAPYHVIARMTFADRAAADTAFASPAGAASVEDLGHFAGAGVTVLHVPRAGTVGGGEGAS